MKPTCKFCLAHHDADEGHPPEAVRAALAELRRTEPKVSAIEVGRKTFEEAREQVAGVTKPQPVTSPVTSPEPPVTVHVTSPQPVTSPSSVTKEQAWRERNRDQVREADRKRQQRRRAAHNGGVDGMPGSTS